MTDRERARLEHFERLAGIRAPVPTVGIEAKLATREAGVLRSQIEEAKKVLSALERRGEQRGAQIVRATLRRQERELLAARERMAGLPPVIGDRGSSGLRERAAIPFP
jgi:uncharacterized protein YmfQ (DUF2313 family)